MSKYASTREAIDTNHALMYKHFRRRSLFVPVLSTIAFGGCLVLLVYRGITEGTWGELVSQFIIYGFAIMMVWFHHDLDARRRTAVLKYASATAMVDQFAEVYDWTWEDCPEAGAVSLHKVKDDDAEDDEDRRITLTTTVE